MKFTVTTTKTTHKKNDLHWIYTTSEAERDPEFDIVWYSEIPYCEYWSSVRQIPIRYEFSSLLGDQSQELEDTMGQPCLFTGEQGPQRTLCSDCRKWDSCTEQLFI